MTAAVYRAPIAKGILAPTDRAPAWTNDAVDLLALALTTIVDYVRPKNIADPTVPFLSNMAVTVTPLEGTAAIIAHDAHFNNTPTIDLSPMDANAFQADAACPASFTFIAPIYLSAILSVNQFFGVVGSNWEAYIDSTRHLVVDDKYGSGESPFEFTEMEPIATMLPLWISHDAPSKTTRFGLSSTVIDSHVHAMGHAPGSTSWMRPFSFYANGPTNTVINGQTAGWMLLSKAYAADGSGEDDAIGAFIDGWKAFLGG